MIVIYKYFFRGRIIDGLFIISQVAYWSFFF